MQDEFSADMTAPTVVIMQFERAWVEALDVIPALEALGPLVVDGEVTRRYAGSLLFMFSGYDECELELWDIPQVRDWFRELTSSFPYWFVFCQRRAEPLGLVINLLLGPGIPEPGRDGGPPMRRHAVGALSDLMRSQFGAMNLLCQRPSIPAETTQAWTREIVRALNAATSVA